MSHEDQSTSPPTYPHVLIGEILKEIRDNDQGRPRKHVAILGGGMAGLVAAYELTRLDHTVDVIEASSRTGGRVWTHHFNDESYNELGAMRIPPSHDYTHYYITKMGLDNKLIPFINSTPSGFWDIHNVITRNTPEEVQGKIYPKFRLSEFFRTGTPSGGAIFGFLLENLIKTLTEAEVDSLFAGHMDTNYLRYLGNLSLGEFLNRNAGMDAKEVAGVFTSLEVWYDKAITMFIRDELVGTGKDLVTIEGGMDQLPQRLTDHVAAAVTCHTEVLEIERREDDTVAVRTRNTQNGETESNVYDYVLCTIPFSVMRRMQLEGLTYGKMRAIRNIAYANGTKVLLDCDQRFWQSDKYCIFGGSSISDHIQRQTYFPMNRLKASREKLVSHVFRGLHTAMSHQEGWTIEAKDDWQMPGALTGAYCWGRDARRLGAVDEENRRRVVVENIERYLPELGSHVVGSASIDWEEFKWAAGAFAFFRPGDIELYYRDAIRPEGRLFFAGEHCSTDPAWIQGSLIASLRAVNEIVEVP